jgi:fluoride exporter
MMRTLVEWKPFVWISLGAVLGANLRYLISRIIARSGDFSFPYSTLLINMTGSLVLGFFVVWTSERIVANPAWRLLIAVGFCGSYTTFSGYAYETMAHLQQGHWMLAAINFVSNNVLCLLAVLAGGALARAL